MLILILTIGTKMYSQTNKDLFAFDYALAPANNEDVDLNKTSLLINIPAQWQNFEITAALDADYYRAEFLESFPLETSELERLYNVSAGVDFRYNLAENWSFTADFNTAIASNLTSKISNEDLLYTGGFHIAKTADSDLPLNIKLGLGYRTYLGKPKWLPELSISQQLDENLSYEIGFPQTQVRYALDPNNSFMVIATQDGMYANLSTPIILNTNTSAAKTELSATTLSLGYEYALDDNWSFSLKGGYLLKNKFNLLNNTENQVFAFDMPSRPFFSTGIKFNLKK